MTKMTQAEILIGCMKLLAKSDLFNKPGVGYWWGLVKHCHKQGFLYVGFDGNYVNSVAIAYRFKKVSDIEKNEVPLKDDGNILFVLAYVTTSKDRFAILRFLRHHLRNNPEIEYVAFKRHSKDDRLRFFNIRSSNNGQGSKTKLRIAS